MTEYQLKSGIKYNYSNSPMKRFSIKHFLALRSQIKTVNKP